MFNPYYIFASLTGVAAFFSGVRWLYRRSRSKDVTEVFVHDMATNHLPHIYDALRLLCIHEGINMPNPPPIHFMDFRKYPKED